MKYIKYLIVCFLILPFNVIAANKEVYLECDTYTLSINESTTCKIVLNALDNNVTNFKADISVSSNLELTDVSINDDWQGINSFNSATGNKDNANIDLTSVKQAISNKSVIGSFKFKVKSGEPETNENVYLKNVSIVLQDSTNNESLDDINKTIRIPSNNASLTNLEVSTGTLVPAFSPDVLEYTISDITSGNVNISASGNSNASISGIGNKQLSYGDNKFEIVVKAESGVTKTYTINVNRNDNRSGDNSLKNIRINGEAIEFDSKKTNYHISIPSSTKNVKISAEPNDDKAKVSYSSISRDLELGELYTFKINVTAENGNISSYFVSVTREDERSSNNNLKSLSVNNDNIDIKNSQSYTLTVANNVTTADIKYTLEDAKANASIEGNNSLKVGSNQFKIKVTAENEAIKTYTITIIRKNEDGDVTNLSNNTNLKSLIIKDYDIDFKKDTLSYNIDVESNVSKLDIKYTLEDTKASASIDGNKNFKEGLNKVKIIVTAENGETTTYTINVTKESKLTEVENDKNKIISALKDKNNFEQILVNVVQSDSLIIPSDIIKELIDSKKMITYNVLVNNKNKYSISLDGNLFTEYNGNIDYKISFNDNIDSDLTNLIGSSKNIVLNFSHSGDLPTGTSFKVYVNDVFADGNSLYLYYYNDLKELELITKNLKVTDGYVSFSLEHCSTYVLVNSTLEKEEVLPDVSDEPKKDNNMMIYVGIGIGSVIVIILVVVVILVQKKKQSKKEDNVTNLNNNINTTNNITPISEIEKTEIFDFTDLTETTEYLFGVSVMDINDYIENCPLSGLKNDNLKEGIVVVSVDNNSPVAKAGIIQDDVLLEISNKKIKNKENFKQLIKDAKHGNKYTIKYYRNGSTKKVKVSL